VWSAELEAQTAARSITLQLEGLENLGQVAFHASTLRRAVLNLLQNALDAMPNGGTLSIACQSTPTQVQLRVQDTGIGIPAERLGRILSPYIRQSLEGQG